MKFQYKNIFIITSIFIISSCGGGSPGGPVFEKLAAVITSFSSSLNTSEVGSSFDISWTSTNSFTCMASGSWSGVKTISGTESVTVSSTGGNLFLLTCEGRGGSDNSSFSVDGYRNISGITVDGYITGATIFIDQNEDFELGSDEDSSTSGNSGEFTNKHSNGTLISKGGQDLDTQTQLDSLMLLRNLSGYSSSNFSITPITTISYFLPEDNLYNLLGIDSSIDFMTVDPVSLKGDSGINDYHYEKGNQLTILALSLFNIKNALLPSSPSTSTKDYFKAIAEELKKENVITTTKVNIESESFISNVIDNVVTAKSLTISDSSKLNTAKALASVLPLIAVNISDDVTTSLINFALNTLQTDVVSISNGQADVSLIASYNSDIFNYIAADQNVDANGLIPDISSATDTAETPEDVTVSINIIANDSYTMNAPIAISLSQPSNGSVSLQGSGIVNYTPDGDFNGNDSFTYTITQGDKTSTSSVNIVINAVNDAPVLNLASTIQAKENQTSVSSISPSDVDGDTLTLTLSGSDATSFSLTNVGVLSFISAPDYEVKKSYSITISATDGTLTVSKDITVAITNVNDVAPVISSSASYSSAENQTTIGSVSASDVEGDTLTYSISGTELAISSTGVITFISAPDYETKSSYTATVTVSDGVNTASKALTISVTNINDIAPVISSAATYSAAENQTGIGSVSASDAEGDTLTYSISGSELAISSAGVISFKAAPDFETKTSYTATVTVSDGVNTASKALTISVTNVNDIAPVITSSASSYALNENSTAVIGTITASDAEGDSVVYSTSGTDASFFNIGSSSGVLTLKVAPDYETKSSYSFNVVASDGVNSGSKAITLSIANLNDNSPSFTSSAAQSLIEGNTAVGTIAATDADGNSVTYTLSGTNASLASLTSGGVLTLNSKADYESKTSYSVIVTATDGTNTTTQTITISVTNDTYDDISMPKKIQLAELKKENG